MSQTSDDETTDSDNVSDKNSPDLRVVAANRPRQVQERHDADEPSDQGNGLKGRLESSENHECAKQAEKNGPMPHQYFEVRLIERKPVKRRQPLASKNAAQRKKMDQADNDQHCGN